MRRGCEISFDDAMTSIQRLQLTLVLDPASDPITGTVGDAHGKSVDFSGWLGFAAALEQLLSAARPTSAELRPAIRDAPRP